MFLWVTMTLIFLCAATWIAALVLRITRSRKDPIMATVQELQTAADNLNSAVQRAVPLIRDAGSRIDPAALDPVLASLNQTTADLTAALPPQ